MHENQTPSLINDHPEADIPVYFARAISSKLANNKRRHKKIQIVLVLAFILDGPRVNIRGALELAGPAQTTFPGSTYRVHSIEDTTST